MLRGGGMPLAFTQEDFLVVILFSVSKEESRQIFEIISELQQSLFLVGMFEPRHILYQVVRNKTEEPSPVDMIEKKN